MNAGRLLSVALLVVVVAAAAAWAGIEFGRWSRAPQTPLPMAENSGKNGNPITKLLVTSLKTPNGEPKKLAEWQDKILVVNFWATWCPPCREEMPEFSRAQDKLGANGVQIVGIAIDEAANVVEFSKLTPVSYPLLIAPTDMSGLMAELGNRQQGLPFTIIIGRDGKLILSHLGPLTGEALAKQLAPHL
jgi:thiol-disulfide isomerase/thioredoxin